MVKASNLLIFDHLVEGACYCHFENELNSSDFDFRIQRINPAMCNLLGIHEEKIQNVSAKALFKVNAIHFSDYIIESLKQNQVNEFKVFCHFAQKNLKLKCIPESDNTFFLLAIDNSKEVLDNLRLEDLKQSLELAYRSGNIGIWELDLVNHSLSWDDWMFRMYGISPNEFKEAYEVWSSSLHPEDKERAEREVSEAIEGKQEFNTEFRIITPQGEIRYLRAFASVIRDKDGKAIKMTGVNYNVTQERQYFEQLKESEEKFRILADTTPAAIMFYQNDYWVYANPASVQITGYSVDEILQMKFWDFVHKDDQEIVKLRGSARQNNKDTEPRYEFRIVTKHGDIKWVYLTGSSVIYQGKPAGMIMVIDIDQRRKVEDALRESFHELTKITENIPVSIWKSDVGSLGEFSNTYISENINELLALPQNTIENDWDSFFQLVLPEYLPEIKSKFAEAIQNPGKFLNFQYQVKKGNGDIAWFISEGRIYVEDGKMRAFGYTADVTSEHIHREELLLKERAMQVSIDGIAVHDADGLLTYLNPSHAKVYGWDSPVELLGKSWETLYDKTELNRFETEIMPEFFRTGFWHGEAIGMKKDGSFFTQDLSLTALDDGGLICIVRDVSQRKAIENALSESERNLQAVFNNTHQLFIMIDREYRIVSLNKIAKDYYKNMMNADVDSGHDIRELVIDDHKEDFHQVFSNCLDGKTQTIIRDYDNNGEKYWFNFSYHPVFGKKNHVDKVVLSILDITEQKRSEHELLKAKDKAEESDRLKSAFLANMSHEIRTPMNGILGFADLLKSPDLSEDEQNEYLNVIQEAGSRMLSIINDLVEISRIESGQLVVVPERFKLADLLNELFQFFKLEAEKKQLSFKLSKQCQSSEMWIDTDWQKLNQVLSNLLKNAIKFTQEGEVQLACQIGDGQIVFLVEDTGVGIPKNMQPVVFDRFRQVNDEYTKMIEGTGLGLSICKAYVELLGGEIWLESELGKGSKFYFSIPANCVEPVIEEIRLQEEQPPQISAIKVLVAEDDESSVKLYQNYVKGHEIQLIVACDGEEAINLLNQNDEFDIAFIDIKMPKKNGFQVLNEIVLKHSHIPVIIQSAFASNLDKSKAIKNGAMDFITKPVSKSDFLRLIADYAN